MEMPLFISFTDCHFTTRAPIVRGDDFYQTQIAKFSFLCRSARNTKYHLMVCAGDFFDSVRSTSFGLISDILSLIECMNVNLLVVPGQHDMRFHDKSMKNTPLELMSKHHLVTSLLEGNSRDFDELRFYGFGWGDKIEDELCLEDEVWKEYGPKYKIAIMHRPIFQFLPVWDHDFMLTTDALRERGRGIDLFITGDNHEQFIDLHGVPIVNSGNILRSYIDKINYQPKYVEYFEQNEKLVPEFKDIPVMANVWNQEAINDTEWLQKAIKSEIDNFTEALKKDFNPSYSFMENIVCMAENIDPGLINRLFEDMR